MIEFKGDCGHLIRARDEDAGKVVRCSYCGREATVARPVHDDDPAALLDAVEQTGAYDPLATKAMRKSHREQQRAEKRAAAGKPPKIDPFAVILKMTYLAIIIVIGAVALKYVPGWYRQLSATSSPPPTVAGGGDAVPEIPRPAAHTPPPAPVQHRKGLLTASLDIHPDGAYVSSVPPGGLILHTPGWGVGDGVFKDDEARVELYCDAPVKLTPGKHTIAVAVKINDPTLMGMPGYTDLRRALEASPGDEDAAKRLSAFLLPDDDICKRSVRIGKYRYIARVYQVEVNNSWVAVTALFLPRSPLTELVAYLPAERRYAFEQSAVEGELEFYRVPEEDRPILLDALARVGRISYHDAADAPYRLFQIDPVDGAVTTDRLDY